MGNSIYEENSRISEDIRDFCTLKALIARLGYSVVSCGDSLEIVTVR